MYDGSNAPWQCKNTAMLKRWKIRQAARLRFWDECGNPLRAGVENVEALKSAFWIPNCQYKAFVAVLYTSRLHWQQIVSLKLLERLQNWPWKQVVEEQPF